MNLIFTSKIVIWSWSITIIKGDTQLMKFQLYKVSGFEEAIMSLRMSQGKFYSWEKAQQVQDLVYATTNKRGFLASNQEYRHNVRSLGIDPTNNNHAKITGVYDSDVTEFKRLLGLTKNNAMGAQDHHTLMKYIDISFITEGLHRGAQDDLDAHAMGFNNRITRFSTRLAEISETKLSEWYVDKVIPLHEAILIMENGRNPLPNEIEHNGNVFIWSPFGYILEKYANMSEKNGLFKDVQRGLIPLGQEGCALWKSDIFNMRYIYFRRSKLTKASPELKIGMEQLADQIVENVPVFGEHFRMEFTDSGKWEHLNKTRKITGEEWEDFKKFKGIE
jgi:hypothetical protein